MGIVTEVGEDAVRPHAPDRVDEREDEQAGRGCGCSRGNSQSDEHDDDGSSLGLALTSTRVSLLMRACRGASRRPVAAHLRQLDERMTRVVIEPASACCACGSSACVPSFDSGQLLRARTISWYGLRRSLRVRQIRRRRRVHLRRPDLDQVGPESSKHSRPVSEAPMDRTAAVSVAASQVA